MSLSLRDQLLGLGFKPSPKPVRNERKPVPAQGRDKPRGGAAASTAKQAANYCTNTGQDGSTDGSTSSSTAPTTSKARGCNNSFVSLFFCGDVWVERSHCNISSHNSSTEIASSA